MGHKLVNASENLRSYKILVALENSLGEKRCPGEMPTPALE